MDTASSGNRGVRGHADRVGIPCQLLCIRPVSLAVVTTDGMQFGDVATITSCPYSCNCSEMQIE